MSVTKKLSELGIEVLKVDQYSNAEPGGENSITFEGHRRFKGFEKDNNFSKYT